MKKAQKNSSSQILRKKDKKAYDKENLGKWKQYLVLNFLNSRLDKTMFGF